MAANISECINVPLSIYRASHILSLFLRLWKYRNVK